MSLFSRLFGRTTDQAPDAGTLAPTDFVAERAPDAPIIDVRTPAEYAAGHLAGAINVDVQSPDFAQRIEALGLPERKPVYLYCRSGNRSGKAAQMLQQMGHGGAVNAGGFDALARAGAETA